MLAVLMLAPSGATKLPATSTREHDMKLLRGGSFSLRGNLNFPLKHNGGYEASLPVLQVGPRGPEGGGACRPKMLLGFGDPSQLSAVIGVGTK